MKTRGKIGVVSRGRVAQISDGPQARPQRCRVATAGVACGPSPKAGKNSRILGRVGIPADRYSSYFGFRQHALDIRQIMVDIEGSG
jgi:hypothetical protein